MNQELNEIFKNLIGFGLVPILNNDRTGFLELFPVLDRTIREVKHY